MFCVSVADLQNKVCYFCIDWGDYMGLIIYDSKDTLNIDIVRANDIFFDVNSDIPDTMLVKQELSEIEKAERVSEYTFLGRVKEYGALYSNFLSTGTKTFLNILKNPDKCFDICECGDNVIEFMLNNLSAGKIYWRVPALVITKKDSCDVEYKGKHFYKISEFINYSLYGDDDDDIQV